MCGRCRELARDMDALSGRILALEEAVYRASSRIDEVAPEEQPDDMHKYVHTLLREARTILGGVI